ncbi:hypothetical protein COY90_01240 [Candidatus Roizmanbacteria bacterium CG_4_10_14_0_8_um_filter_39_9]|uniref:Uncharacterized protein n=1 Tax=Candidatus Roizmanbacteria bacterium CG_4_10_14_0_8_um_filter_39_9 TaxID=1974829 RepID=A0A2M7QDM8_9BACT|nr:MAG: hypothetical protein COY90_01240 [Candidatus Roizmanbacteria bacterium CG_4_10_14_0_8_um_filter_39_9]
MKINPQLKEELKKRMQVFVRTEKEKVTVYSVYPLAAGEVSSLLAANDELKGREYSNVIDTSLIGGVIIRFGSKIIDLSLKHLLQTFQKTIHETH